MEPVAAVEPVAAAVAGVVAVVLSVCGRERSSPRDEQDRRPQLSAPMFETHVFFTSISWLRLPDDIATRFQAGAQRAPELRCLPFERCGSRAIGTRTGLLRRAMGCVGVLGFGNAADSGAGESSEQRATA